MKDKKAIMLKFLLTILITILVFAPTIMFVSKALGLESQAEKNFAELVNEIKTVSKMSDGEKKAFVSIMDPNTFILKFSKPENFVTENAKVDYPPECGGKECIVLCQEVDVGDIVTCTKLIGKPLGDNEKVAGFLLFRLDYEMKVGPFEKANIIKMPRRQPLLLEKKNGIVQVTVQNG